MWSTPRLCEQRRQPEGRRYLVCSKGRRHLCPNNTHYLYQSLEDNILRHVPLIFSHVLPEKPKAGDNCVADLEAELERKTKRLNDLFALGDLESAQTHIRSQDAEIQALKGRLVEARRVAKITEHTSPDRLDQLLETIMRPHMAGEDEHYLLRASLAQELRRIIDRVILNPHREIRVVLKEAAGYRAEMEFRNGRFKGFRLTDLDTEEVTEIDRLLFLETQR